MSGELMSGGFIGGRLWYHSFIQHTYNNFDTDTETIMKTDIYYKKTNYGVKHDTENQQT